MASLVKSINHLRHKKILILHSLFQKIGTLPNFSYKASIILTPKIKDIQRKLEPTRGEGGHLVDYMDAWPLCCTPEIGVGQC